ncbi:MAG TPA: host attachment protein, partial [Telluria sp.]
MPERGQCDFAIAMHHVRVTGVEIGAFHTGLFSAPAICRQVYTQLNLDRMWFHGATGRRYTVPYRPGRGMLPCIGPPTRRSNYLQGGSMQTTWILSANTGRARFFSESDPAKPLQEIEDMVNDAVRLRESETERDKKGVTAA